MVQWWWKRGIYKGLEEIYIKALYKGIMLPEITKQVIDKYVPSSQKDPEMFYTYGTFSYHFSKPGVLWYIAGARCPTNIESNTYINN